MSSSMFSQSSKNKPVLGGHETFAFRNGWLKKGVDAVIADGMIFNKDDALVTLGVGKNMVHSIRHWCLATGLLEEAVEMGRSHSLRTTWLADKLLSEDGWDPFLEKDGSLWLLHWQLATNRVRALVWSISFSDYIETEFTKLSVANFITKRFEQYNVKTTRDMVLRELDCFLHTYVTTRASNKQKSKKDSISEDNLDCPLAELDLLRYIPEYDLYHFNVGPKPSLPIEVFGYSLLIYISSVIESRKTIRLEDCIYGHDSPGQVFKLDENSVVEYIEKIEHRFSGEIRIDESSGLSQIYLSESIATDVEGSARDILQSYYE